MNFSIIIPTINRKAELILMLNSLDHQTFKDFEVIIVDQNEDVNFLGDTIESYNERLSLIHAQVPPRGASNARNVGISFSSGRILTFPDDDCEYPHDFLERINGYFLSNEHIGGIVVNTMDKINNKSIANLSSREVEIERNNILKTVIEAGIFIRAKIIKNIRFDENLGVGSISGYWSDEGPDFILRIIEKGGLFKFLPDLKMFHPDPVRVYNEKTSKRAYDYGKGRGYFLRKNKFGIFNLSYYILLYVAGVVKSILLCDVWMLRYFMNGIKGRYEGYFN